MLIGDESAPRLVVTSPADLAGLTLSLSQPQMVIGHSDTADLVLEDRFVSRRHALITADASGLVTILDLNSTGGTFVNGERLEGPRVLRPGDLVQFADLVARFESADSREGATAILNAPTERLPAVPQPPDTAPAELVRGEILAPALPQDAGMISVADPAAGNGGGDGNGGLSPPVPSVTLGSLVVARGSQTASGVWTIEVPGPGFGVDVVASVQTFWCGRPGVMFTVGGTTTEVGCDSAGNATFGFPVYRPTQVTISALPYATAGVPPHTYRVVGTTGAALTVDASLVRSTPSLRLVTPAVGAPVGAGTYGGNVPVSAVTDDSAKFGEFVVTAVPDAGITASLVAATTSTWTGTAVLRALPLGTRSLTVTCACAGAPDVSSSVTIAIVAVDTEPPWVLVTQPPHSGTVVVDPAIMTVQVKGTAGDALSGVVGGNSHIAVALSAAGPQTPATPGSPGDWSAWSAPVGVPGYGSYTLFVWATDEAGNTMPAPLAWPFEVISSYVPATLNDRLSDVEYLAALMQFARDQVTAGAAGPVSSSALDGVLGQPLDKISVPGSAQAAAAQSAVNELRVPAEILRAHIAANGIPTGPGAAGEASYLSAAYQALLSGAGTSYTELRLARGADNKTRQALAGRLGISLYGATSGQPRPDQLDALTLDGPALTEAALETLLGLPATTAGLDPFRAQLLDWQISAQQSQWQAQDTAPPSPVAYAVIVDPDIITTADVQPATPQSAQVLALLQTRSQQLAGQASTLAGLAGAGSGTATAQLAALLGQGLPDVDITALQTQELQGTDISGQLAAAGLDRPGFGYLLQLQTLAAAGLINATEWAAAVDVLVGAFRRRQYSAWATQETGIVLSPDIFQLTGTGPAVSAYRIEPQARASWQATLRTRTTQRQALTDGMTGLVTTTEQISLGILRGALILDIAAAEYGPNPSAQDIDATTMQLTSRYQLDFAVNGSQPTTRLAQGTAALQTLLLLIRSGDNTTVPAVTDWHLTNDQAVFDHAWAWMGTAGSWRSATTTFLFPEAALEPSLLQEYPDGLVSPTAWFQTLCQALAIIGPPDTSASGPAAAYQAAATADLQKRSILGANDTLTYLSDRSLAHQSKLAGWSTALSANARDYARELFWAVPMLVGERLHSNGQYQAALDWLWVALPYNATSPVSSYDPINYELTMPKPTGADLTFPPDWTANLNPFYLVYAGNDPYPYRPYTWIRSTLLAIISCLADYADSEYSAYTAESVAHARDLYTTATRLLAHPSLLPIPPSSPGEAALPIPQLQTLALRVSNQIAKLRQDRDIAGLSQTQAITTGDPITQPTPYYFKVLLARAQQLTQQAATIEAEYLSALEKYDNKTLQLTDAQNAANVAASQLNVHAAQVQEATDAITAATAQKTTATTMSAQYQAAIDAPPNQYEQSLLSHYSSMRDAQNVIAGADAAVGIAQAAAAGSSTPWGALIGAAVGAAVYGTKAAAQMVLNNLQSQVQADQLQASIADRQQQWQIQKASADQDALIATAQVTTAKDQKDIATAEQTVATTQNQQAQATLLTLTTQFTNPDLYKWMSATLGGVYRYFLQQATATARLAQAQLAFERAESQQTFVRIDYWQTPGQLAATATPGGTRGMTGAEQLAEGVSQLDQYAFSTDTRRLNLSQTFSLSQLLPVEFLGLLAAGQISFATPMSWFDHDFPGHYQRLIRQVHVGVVALVPPTRGIRATLSSSGISRVTTASNGTFSPVTLRRDPPAIAFTSPMNATGVFPIDLQPDMLLPFEGSGVDTSWNFSLPPAANPFDFSSISDVLITIDYTALTSPDYQAQVIRALNADLTRSSDCVFSLARDFPDQWYALNNPPPAAASRETTLTLGGENFPAGISPPSLSTTQVAIRLSASGPLTPVPVTLSHGTASGTAVTDSGGIASTRRGAWNALTGTSPAGDWTLSFDASAGPLFQQGLLGDLLLIISWAGQAPAWPT